MGVSESRRFFHDLRQALVESHADRRDVDIAYHQDERQQHHMHKSFLGEWLK